MCSDPIRIISMSVSSYIDQFFGGEPCNCALLLPHKISNNLLQLMLPYYDVTLQENFIKTYLDFNKN